MNDMTMSVRSGPLAVFDVDGTLVDSRASITAAVVRAFEASGLEPPPYEQSRRIVGLSLPHAMQVLAPGENAARVDALVEAYKAAWIDMHRDPIFTEPLYDGAAELLDDLRGKGWRIAMATGKSRRGVETVMAMHGWANLFDSTHCADDGPGKPHPAMLLGAMQALGAEPNETVMIGDTGFDMQMARAAGVRALGVAWGFHTEEEVRAGGADVLVATMSELARELEAFAAMAGGWRSLQTPRSQPSAG